MDSGATEPDPSELTNGAQQPVILVRGDVVTMNASRTVLPNGVVVVRGDRIVAVGDYGQFSETYPAAPVIGTADSIVTPGYINAHQHLTGDRLVASCIPEAIDSQDAIYNWAVPVHTGHTGDDDELSATLAAVAALRNGITCTIEAGTVAHPERVADGLLQVGLRATIGQWGWDTEGLPFAAPTDEVLARQRTLLEAYPTGELVEAWVTLVGHDLMSDELVTGASALAREMGTGLTFHMSPHGGDAAAYLARTGVRPLVHLDRLGVLGDHVLIGHAVHLDHEEIEILLARRSAIVSCPWAYLRLAQGFVGASRHDEVYLRGGRIALGCDSENAGDAVDILRSAALFVGIHRDRAIDPFSFTANDALALATIRGAEAIGKDDVIGSIEIGKQADLVVHSTSGPQFAPRGINPVRQLIWASDGRSVNDVLVAGRVVVRDGTCTTVDLEELRAQAGGRRDALLSSRDSALARPTVPLGKVQP
jgi:5-methylthioadenosine/S-adenosylhomocysteine deaminase